MGVIRGACSATGLDTPPSRYFCSLQVARKTYNLDSYRLPVAAMAAGFDDFEHHQALADAEACAAIILHAAKRHDAADVFELAAATGVRINSLRPVAAAGVRLA
jgi:DNA polymerase-3 subunit epsilon